MAAARLVNPVRSVQGGTAYVVDTSPANDRSFTGPDDRDWNNFFVTEYGATFEWRRTFAGDDDEDDTAARDAANALPLPPWARIRSSPAVGPGTGYTDVSIVLAPGKSLDDLAAFLASQE